MKNLFLIFVLVFLISGVAFAKGKVKPESESIKYLKQAQEQGQVVRNNDEPIHKADTYADSKRTLLFKDKFRNDVRRSINQVVITK